MHGVYKILKLAWSGQAAIQTITSASLSCRLTSFARLMSRVSRPNHMMATPLPSYRNENKKRTIVAWSFFHESHDKNSHHSRLRRDFRIMEQHGAKPQGVESHRRQPRRNRPIFETQPNHLLCSRYGRQYRRRHFKRP